ncbi:cob(I)yrinic acid a,c-diamide adenosyltransferase [Anaeromicropila herbilytica]|uniref:Cob(I)alamin adenosyltransferase n=1 Tax=Anaeromicropila herbilytica TaxID=2785025 RepID=A0A7R7EQ42_9FIRM|nr:cob(I)yrinic acid a,c-diamide adenosyltransferase [Anaeromicropila herbilytica]BCN32968.1 cob(I)alamin adenosyltransferase [Anaeromicropila herbilytica]
MKRLIHIYCGDGKGKTTTAIGLSIRAAGSGMKVLFVQFLKDQSSSELNILSQIANIDLFPCEETFGFIWNLTEEEKESAKDFYSNYLKSALHKVETEHYDMLVLDELMATYQYNFIDRDDFVTFLKNKPESLEVIMTGRNPSPELLDLADYVSDITKVKHPFDEGIPARLGIEL